MPKEKPIEIFMPPNVLKAKVGGNGSIDVSVLKRAEQAIADLKEEFAEWILKDIDRLTSARTSFEQDRKLDNFNALYRAALDLKGQGTTFDFPLVARIASSLATLTDGTGPTLVPMTLIDAHVDAIKVIVRQKIKDPNDAIACVLAGELETRVADFMAKNQAA